MTESAEASMNFDAEMVGPFLVRVSSLNIGFGPKQIATVLETVDELEVNERAGPKVRNCRKWQE
jgi:hypothetical protein